MDSHPTPRWAVVHTPDDLGRFLAKRRSDLGWKQQELAKHLGIPPRYLHEIEAGKDTLAYTRLFALLRELGVAVRVETTPQADFFFAGQPLPVQAKLSPGAGASGEAPDGASGTAPAATVPPAEAGHPGLLYGHNHAARDAVDAFFHDFDNFGVERQHSEADDSDDETGQSPR